MMPKREAIKKALVGTLIGVGIFIIVILLARTPQKQNPPPQSLTSANPAAIAESEENPRIKEIIKFAHGKKEARQETERKLNKFTDATGLRCGTQNTNDCTSLLKRLAEDEQITNTLKKIYEDGSIQILAVRTITPIGARRIYINNFGNLVIEEGASFDEIRKFLGLKPQDN